MWVQHRDSWATRPRVRLSRVVDVVPWIQVGDSIPTRVPSLVKKLPSGRAVCLISSLILPIEKLVSLGDSRSPHLKNGAPVRSRSQLLAWRPPGEGFLCRVWGVKKGEGAEGLEGLSRQPRAHVDFLTCSRISCQKQTSVDTLRKCGVWVEISGENIFPFLFSFASQAGEVPALVLTQHVQIPSFLTFPLVRGKQLCRPRAESAYGGADRKQLTPRKP